MPRRRVREARFITALGFIAALALAILASQPLAAQPREKVVEAIDRGIEHLLSAVEKKQVEGAHPVGQVGLETYALVVAGVSVNHPLLQRNFAYLRDEIFSRRFRIQYTRITYTLSCFIFAVDAALSQIQMDRMFLSGRLIEDGARIEPQLQGQLAKAVRDLVKIRQKGEGRWNYSAGGNNFDNSNTQFAVLALGVGEKREVPISPEVWEEIARHFVEGQQKDGPKVEARVELLSPEERGVESLELVDESGERPPRARASRSPERGATRVIEKAIPEIGDESLLVRARGWSYRDGASHGGYRWNMTCAGLSSLILAARHLEGRVPLDFQNRINVGVRDGFGWLLKHWKVDGGKDPWQYYGVYSLEKVADLAGIRSFGPHDWYAEVASWVLKNQRKDGSWPGNNAQQVRMNTAFALLVLNRATSLLTRSSDRMVLTGPGSHDADRSKREDWVYVRSLDRELHVPSFLRMLRLRPSPKLLEFLELVVKDYPPESIGFLVPGLVTAHEKAANPRVKDFIRDRLAAITGVEHDDMGPYRAWAGAWRTAHEAGREIDRDRAGDLVAIYRERATGVALREKVIWALTRLQAVDAAPLFLEDLSHEEARIRRAAYVGLAALPLGEERVPPFDAEDRPVDRREQVEKIREWYARVTR